MVILAVAPSNLLCVRIATAAAQTPDDLTAGGARVGLAEAQTLLLCVLCASINFVQLDNPAVLVFSIVLDAVTRLLGTELSTICHHILTLSKGPAAIFVFSVTPSDILCVHIATTVTSVPDHLTPSGTRVSAALFQARVLSLLSIAVETVLLHDSRVLIFSVASKTVTQFLWAISL